MTVNEKVIAGSKFQIGCNFCNIVEFSVTEKLSFSWKKGRSMMKNIIAIVRLRFSKDTGNNFSN